MWMHEGAAMRVIETKSPVIAMQYMPSGNHLVYAELERHDAGGHRPRFQTHLHWHSLANGNDTRCETLSDVSGLLLALPGNRIVASLHQGGIRFYDCGGNGLRRVEPPTGNPDGCHLLAYSDDARYLAWIRILRPGLNRIIWQDSKDLTSQGTFRSRHPIGMARFSNDSAYLATAGSIFLTLWSMAQRESVATWSVPPSARYPKKQQYIHFMEFSPDVSTLFVCTHHGSYVWNPGAGKVCFEIPTVPSCGAYSSTGRLLAIAKGRTVEIWDVDAGQRRVSYEWPLKSRTHYPTFQRIAYSPDGATMAAGSTFDGGIVIWDLDNL
jgi:WD40 repeat protein